MPQFKNGYIQFFESKSFFVMMIYFSIVHLYHLKGVLVDNCREAEIIPKEPGRVMSLRDACCAYLEYLSVYKKPKINF